MTRRQTPHADFPRLLPAKLELGGFNGLHVHHLRYPVVGRAAMRSAQCSLLMLCVVGLSCTANAQTIFTIAGVPSGHRKAVDGQPALTAPLNPVYGLLFDNVTGRLLFHDGTLVERVEPDGSLLALAGRGEPQDGDNGGRHTSQQSPHLGSTRDG